MQDKLRDLLLILRHLKAGKGWVASRAAGRVGAAVGRIAGLTLLGRGAYSRVYEWTATSVLRISMSVDDPYPAYVRLTHRVVRRPWMPVVHWHSRVGQVHVAIIERLYKQRGRSKLTEEEYKYLARRLPANAKMDVHQANIMRRSDGTLVVTDPWSHR